MTHEDLMQALACCNHQDGLGCGDCPLAGLPSCEARLIKAALREIIAGDQAGCGGE